MNSPPQLETLNKIKDSPIWTISFGLYVSHITFENGNIISFTAPFRFADDKNIYDAAVFEFPLQGTNLVRLLGKAVSEVLCDPDGTLDLEFDNTDRLIIYANDPMYEAYTLTIDGREYVV